jgi:hypothetical protein
LNTVFSLCCRPRAALEPFVLLLAPYAPHIAEELWSRLGHSSSLAYEPWPEADESLLVVDTINLPVQVGSFSKLDALFDVPVANIMLWELCCSVFRGLRTWVRYGATSKTG